MERNRQRDVERDRERETEREIWRKTERERQRERDMEKDRGRDRQRWRNKTHTSPSCLATALVLTVHLAFVREDDLPPAARRVDGQCLLEALLDVWAPHALRVPIHALVPGFTQMLHVLPSTLAATPAAVVVHGDLSGLLRLTLTGLMLTGLMRTRLMLR